MLASATDFMMKDFHYRRLRERVCSAIVSIVAAVSLAACGASEPLRVATSGDYAPFSSSTSYGAIVGFDATVAAQFARDTKREVTFVPLRWPRLMEQAQADVFDVAMSGVTMRADRVPQLYFSRPYAMSGAVVVVRRERASELDTLARIDSLDVRLAVNRGGHLERLARARFAKAQLLTVDDNRTLADLVLRGEVDGAVSDLLEIRAWPDAFAVIGPFSRDRKAYAVPVQRLEVLQRVNDWLIQRESDGWLNDERRRWLGEAAAWSADAACFEAIAAAIDLRMLLMPRVAAAKRQLDLPIADPEQEQKVLAEAAQWAAAAGLDAGAAMALFERLIAAAKEIQTASLNGRPFPADADLASLRAAIGYYSRRIIDEAAGCRQALGRAESRPALEAALRGGDSKAMRKVMPASEIAPLIAALAGATSNAAPIAAPAQPEYQGGSYVEFCVSPNRAFDRQGYSADHFESEHPIFAAPAVDAVHPLQPGRTRVPSAAGRNAYGIYVNGSTADPNTAGGATPANIQVIVPENGVVGIRFTPTIQPNGQIELRQGPYHGVTRFDAVVESYDPNAASPADRCPW